MDVKVSKEKNISTWVDQENFNMSDEIESKTAHKEDKGD